MADYQLYDLKNFSVLTDPQTETAQIYKDYDTAILMSQQGTGRLVIKDSIPPHIKENIQNHLGEIVYSNERLNDQGHFAIVKDKVHGTYDALKIEKGIQGYEIQVKSGFPDQRQAYDFIDKQQSLDKLNEREMEIGR